MNYLTEINSFYDWLETNPLATSSIALWFALMHIANKAGWPDKFAVAISVLELKTGLKKDAICDARNRLEQSGRLQWESRKGNQSAIYKLLPLASIKTTQIPTQNNAVSDKPTQSPTQLPTQSPTQLPTIIKLNKTKQKYDLFAEVYPNMKKAEQTRKNWDALVKKGVDPDLLLKAAKNYAQYCMDNEIEQRYMIYSSNFIGRHAEYKEFINYTPLLPKSDRKEDDVNWLS